MKRLAYFVYLAVLILISSCAQGINCPTYSHSNTKTPIQTQPRNDPGQVFNGGF